MSLANPAEQFSRSADQGIEPPRSMRAFEIFFSCLKIPLLLSAHATRFYVAHFTSLSLSTLPRDQQGTIEWAPVERCCFGALPSSLQSSSFEKAFVLSYLYVYQDHTSCISTAEKQEAFHHFVIWSLHLLLYEFERSIVPIRGTCSNRIFNLAYGGLSRHDPISP